MSKRNRPPIPTYIKFYSVFKYDREKFRQLLNGWLRSNEGQNRTLESLRKKQKEILRQCYERDDYGGIARNSDEKHIFRIKTLYKIYKKIYEYLIIFFKFGGKTIDELEIDFDEEEIEIKNTWRLPICDRIKVHVKLLKMLKQGVTIDRALKEIRKDSNDKIRQEKLSKAQR